jgi:hypothetical protein
MIGYADHMVPEVVYNPSVSSELVMVSVTALANAFFVGVDRFLVDLFARPEAASIAEQRFNEIIHCLPYATSGHGE